MVENEWQALNHIACQFKQVSSLWHNTIAVHIALATFILKIFAYSWNRLRVVPLFETVKDLRAAGSVIRKLLSIDWYREHIIKNHNGHQEVFIPKMHITIKL